MMPLPAKSFPYDRLGSLLLRFLNQLKLSGRSMHTISAYRNDLGAFTEFLTTSGYDPSAFGTSIQDDWLHFLKVKGRKSLASTRRALMSVRTFCHYLMKENLITASPFLEVKSPRQPNHDLLTILPHQFQKLSTVLRDAALAPSATGKDLRNWVLVLTLCTCALKASELSALKWRDTSMTSQNMGILHVRGLNERILPIGDELALAMATLRGFQQQNMESQLPESSILFPDRNGNDHGERLSRHSIKAIVYEITEQILGVPYNSESLRNFAISRWIEQGIASEKIAELAGYSSLNSLDRFSLTCRSVRKSKRQSKTIRVAV